MPGILIDKRIADERRSYEAFKRAPRSLQIGGNRPRAKPKPKPKPKRNRVQRGAGIIDDTYSYVKKNKKKVVAGAIATTWAGLGIAPIVIDLINRSSGRGTYGPGTIIRYQY